MTSTRRRRPTLDDVAEAVGVSRATVSNAYNRPDQLSAPLREQVLRAAKELGYAGPNPTARSLATSRTGAIAVLLDTSLSTAFSDPALSVTLDALARAVDPGGHALLLLPGGDPRGGPPAERVLAAQADIAVAYSLADGTPALDAVHERGLPLVVIDQPLLPGTSRIGCQDRQGAALAARHLLELGHRRFGIFAAASRVMPGGGSLTAEQGAAAAFRDTRERLAGYLEVLTPFAGAGGSSAAGLVGGNPGGATGLISSSASGTESGTAGSAGGNPSDATGLISSSAGGTESGTADLASGNPDGAMGLVSSSASGAESSAMGSVGGDPSGAGSGVASGVAGPSPLAGAADVVIEEAAGLSAESAMTGAFALLGRTPRPTALLCMSDQLALAAIAVARQLGIRVPEELSVVGFDDTSVAGWSEPPLTTVRQDLAAKGRIAGELVLHLLAGTSPAAPDEVPVELVVRASTARA
ncbi:LacI family DNA-binding transcriptional regulator [Amycolatopsis sp., V23-08]|uniref:LacI family DNA-binding transcriptional regulator n=1 Tax=Amycolatopsis heterodermiae TaxID=3110235 RepID=A0ABU5RMT8_9PSEU|nr:LacI family DNA-binding transcriptional regulator [Amycolatopsis sp., V23-08]MEA5366904.1 LacI family DNA-binding transcriptional regulator [Amycolatopsis sp., V23-08]